MRLVGFSTGSLALGDFNAALTMMEGQGLTAIELSALRESELEPLLCVLDSLNLDAFQYVSVHAPSRLETMTDVELAGLLYAIVERGYRVVVHPDVIEDYECWAGLGDKLCIENMDRRKAMGRTAAELAPVFRCLPQASLCLDLGHARQVDPTMSQAAELLAAFGHRLAQVHISEVNAQSVHERLTIGAINAFQRVAPLISPDVPLILESPVMAREIASEVRAALRTMATQKSHSVAIA